MTENSLFSTSSDMLSRAVTALPLRGVKRSVTSLMRSLGLPSPSATSEALGPRQQPVARRLEHLIGQKAEKPNDCDSEKDLVGVEPAHRIENEIPQSLVAGDEFRDNEVSPRPSKRDAQGIHHPRHGSGNEHAAHHRAPSRPKRIGHIEQVMRNASRNI